jgi:acyl-CoA oxidase
LNGLYIKDFGGPGLTTLEAGSIIYEISKRDASISAFIMVHNSIGTSTIHMLGNEEQKQRFLPDLISLKKICCWALTEPDFGSDASSLQTTAKKVEGGYLLNGTKRWIGNAAMA